MGKIHRTEAKILAASRALFVKNGFSATSISEIAKKAKINQSLIYHHFGDKEALWKAVKKEILIEQAASEELRLDAAKGLKYFLKQAIQNRYNFYRSNPDILRMMTWQRLESKRDQLAGGTHASPNLWIEPIRALQKQKEIDPALDPQMIVMFLVSLVEGALTQNYGWEKSAPLDLDAYILKTMHWAEKVLQPNAHSTTA
ncbi:MAG: TetR/AcrR family transcriptional regulator [Verrucomicrobia bacterium]|nr:TetR/AcrR family transcriptional regulator [Verrucomicrobiota bacterium]